MFSLSFLSFRHRALLHNPRSILSTRLQVMNILSPEKTLIYHIPAHAHFLQATFENRVDTACDNRLVDHVVVTTILASLATEAGMLDSPESAIR